MLWYAFRVTQWMAVRLRTFNPGDHIFDRCCFLKIHLLLMKCLIVFFACLSMTPPLVAQNVDFEIPTEINIIEGRLSVAFKDGIHEAEARSLMASLGYDVLQVHFKPLIAVSSTPSALDEEVVGRLRAADGVLNVHAGKLPESAVSTGVPPWPSDTNGYKTWVEFQSHLSAASAVAILKAHTHAPFAFITKPANEIVIDVGDEDEAAFSRLDGHEKVKWVTYVGVAGG